jgi:hypothetical protein
VLVLLVWLRGGRWERLAAAAQIIASVVTPMVQDIDHPRGPQYGYVVVDGILFLVLTAIALRSRLWWATWAAGFQLLGVLIHVARAVDEQVVGDAYFGGILIYTYLLTITIMIGAWTHKRE